ncbi:hypothetical protein BACOV975_03945 [Bacteroides ovatus V975]|nr:hypothetical protein BACOV975_03945 [Bacteroides ovatus V975]
MAYFCRKTENNNKYAEKNLSRLTFISTLWHGNAQKMAIQSIVHRFSFYLCMKYNITNT